MNGRLPVLFRDEHFLVVDKPFGMIVHNNSFDRDGLSLMAALARQEGEAFFGVQRLDRNTSGLILVAKSSQAAARACDALQKRDVVKTYMALVRGHAPDHSFVDKPLPRERDGELREASTEFRCLAKAAYGVSLGPYPETWFSLVTAMPLTGRRHQIRRHLHSLRHPIIGDRIYGDKKLDRAFVSHFGCELMFLRCTGLSLNHPFADKPLRCETGLPESWKEIFAKINLTMPPRKE